jgi:hypothetical protein
MASQSFLDCSEAAGDVNSIYSTPKSESALAILILVSVSKKAFANCKHRQIRFADVFLVCISTCSPSAEQCERQNKCPPRLFEAMTYL